MKVSVIVCVRNQSSRLRLVLAALARQIEPAREIIVVDDASDVGVDATGVTVVRNHRRGGSAAARNIGARRASGELLIFVDGDAIPAPDFVARHMAFAGRYPGDVGFGSLFHFPSTEFLVDPDRTETIDASIPPAVRDGLLHAPARFVVTAEDALDPGRLAERTSPGAYPGLAFMESAAEALGEGGTHAAAWMLVVPQNLSIPRDRYQAISGFDEALPFLEGWDLALRLATSGAALRRVDARTHHLYHYRPASFAERARRWRALRAIAKKHRRETLVLAQLWFASHDRQSFLPAEAGPLDLDHVAQLMDADDLGPYRQVLRAHPVYSELEAEIALEAARMSARSA